MTDYLTSSEPVGGQGPLHILLYQRRLTRKIAGGARSVYDRGTILHNLGYKVTFVILEKSPGHGRALAELRRDGILHPCNDFVFVQDLLQRHQDCVNSLTGQPVQPLFVPGLLEPNEIVKKDKLSRHDYHFDEVLRKRVSYYDAGFVRRQEFYDESGNLTERWQHDLDGTLLFIDQFKTANKEPVWRKLIVAGRYVFCEVDMSVPLGLGEGKFSDQSSNTTFAELVAQRILEYFSEDERLVFIADGENTSQNILRAFPAGRVQGISVLHNNHTEFPFTPDSDVKKNWRSFLENMNNVFRVICLTKRQEDDLKLLYPSMPLSRLNHPMHVPPVMKVKRDPNSLVFVGRLSYQKQLNHLAKVFELVTKELPYVKIDVYGDGDKRQWLSELLEEAGLSKVVKIRGFTEKPLEAFAGAAITVMTSYFEGLPLTILEAMSVGTPFVAYDLNYGPAEVIRSGENGVLVENGKPEAAAQAIISLFKDPAKLRRMSETAIKDATQYDLTQYQEAWKDLIEASQLGQTNSASQVAEADLR